MRRHLVQEVEVHQVLTVLTVVHHVRRWGFQSHRPLPNRTPGHSQGIAQSMYAFHQSTPFPSHVDPRIGNRAGEIPKLFEYYRP